MPRVLRSIAALVLALIWLPATLHCGLEAAGFLDEASATCCAHDEPSRAPSSDCTHGACGVVESGDYQPAHSFIKVVAPLAVICFSSLIEITPEQTIVPAIIAAAEVESPPEVRRTWQFVARAALSPRAPSLIC